MCCGRSSGKPKKKSTSREIKRKPMPVDQKQDNKEEKK